MATVATQDISVTIEDAQPISVTLDVAGASNFVALNDVPGSYVGEADKIIKVNLAEDGLEFADLTTVVSWGEILGTLSDQLDLQAALDLKVTFDTDQNSELSTNGNPQFESVDIVDTFIAGESVISGDLCYYKSDGKFWKSNSSAESTSKGLLSIAKETILANNSGLFMLQGKQVTSGLTTADELYLSTTASEWTATKPSATGQIVRLVAYALSSTVLYFNPDNTYIEVA